MCRMTVRLGEVDVLLLLGLADSPGAELEYTMPSSDYRNKESALSRCRCHDMEWHKIKKGQDPAVHLIVLWCLDVR